MSKTREKYPLSKKKILKKTIVQSIGCSMVVFFFIGCLAIAGLIAMFRDNPTIAIVVLVVAFVLWLGLLVLIYFYQMWYFATYYYEIREDYITIKKGPIMPNEINIVYQKIQDVYVDQDLFDRMFGLYDVHLATATFTSLNLSHIDGLEKKEADALRDELLDIFKKKVNK